MDRRAFFKSVAGAVRLVPHTDLANFDPIWSSAAIARNAGLLVWDMLYGMDATLKVQRQMVEAEEVSGDGLTWTFRLRPRLKFHDGEPVRAQDAVASINRWSARDPTGQMLKAIEHELVVVDDRTFRWVLEKPFPKMLLALGKIGTPCCFVMPARIAATDPFKQINEYIGSGPMRFVRNDWVPGVKSAFERFADYVPREDEASWLAGGKRIAAARVEWIVMPDPSTAAAALQTGEIDWWETAIPDLVPLLRQNRSVMVDVADPLGQVGVLVMNHLFPPFNDVRARRAILMAMNQEEYMRALVGANDELWRPLPGYFTPGTAFYTEEGGGILKGQRNLDAARHLLADSGYAGQPVTCMAAQDLPHHKAWGDVTVDLLKRLGVNVDFVAVDWGTVVARRVQKNPPRQGGWQMYHTSYPGDYSLDPANKFIHADGTVAVGGWANSQEVEAEIAAWFDATTLEQEKAAARRLNKAALDHVVYAPLGWYLRHHAWRKSLTGITPGPLPFFWGVSKTV
jgi:peptide/nickel transport system substrate-binding protein